MSPGGVLNELIHLTSHDNVKTSLAIQWFLYTDVISDNVMVS